MDTILQQILDLLEHAPLTQTGKNDIRHTIRTEYYLPPEIVTLDTPDKPLKYVSSNIDDPDCYCPNYHPHTQQSDVVRCAGCDCTYTIQHKVTSRVVL